MASIDFNNGEIISIILPAFADMNYKFTAVQEGDF